MIPWSGWCCVTWDVTVADTLAESYLPVTSTVQGGTAEGVAELKYQQLANLQKILPLAFETFVLINSKGLSFDSELGRRLTNITGEPLALVLRPIKVAVRVTLSKCE